MTTVKSAKAKGRKLQNWVRDTLKEFFGFTDDDIRCAIMGEGGEDIKLLSHEARSAFQFSTECKNREVYKGVYAAYEQHKEANEPLLIIKMNGKSPLAIIDARVFIEDQAWIARQRGHIT